jgi:hypothetical protein
MEGYALSETQRPHISLLVPVVERFDDLHALHRAFASEVEKLGSYEFLYLVSAEFEDAFQQALELHKGDPERVRVLRFARCIGEATALATGLDRARGEIAVTVPAYFDANPAGIRDLCAALDDGADLAFASRTVRVDGLLKALQTKTFNRLVSWAAGAHYDDVASPTRALRREIIEDVPLYGDFHRFLPVLAHSVGYRVTEVPVAQDPRSRAPRVYRLRTYFYRALDILSMFFLSRFTRRPLRLFGAAGSAFGAIGGVILLVVGIQRLMGSPIADRPILILGTLLLGLGVQTLTIGLLGELILFYQARDVRDYRIAEIHEADVSSLPESSASSDS